MDVKSLVGSRLSTTNDEPTDDETPEPGTLVLEPSIILTILHLRVHPEPSIFAATSCASLALAGGAPIMAKQTPAIFKAPRFGKSEKRGLVT